MLFDDKDVAVLDLTHGGIPLARYIAKRAHSVAAVDVYGTLDSEVLAELEKHSIKIAETIDDDVDLIVAPIHLNPALLPDTGNCDMITHHRAVGELLLNTDIKAKVVEITGTGAKTSTAALLADITSRRMSVVSHTSRGLEHWINGVPRMLHRGLSIAPGSILEALEYSDGINPDLYIFEISLGGTGAADVGIITSLDNEYTIASGHRTSTMAKTQMIEYAKEGSTLVINASAGQIDPPYGVMTITFSDISNQADVYLNVSETGIWTIHYSNHGRKTIFRPNDGYDPAAYSTAMVCAAAAAGILEIDPEIIQSVLLDFQGVHGRMRQVEWAGRIMVDNSNSGMNIRSVQQALEYSKKIATGNNSRFVMILGEEARQICEGLEPENVKSFLEAHKNELDGIILVGERMRAMTGDNIHYASSLNNAVEMAEALTEENDIIVSCVKCFR